MNKKIKLCNKDINYILKTSIRAKRMRLVICNNGSFVVTRPYLLSQKKVEKFIIEKANWIIKKIEYFKQFKKSSFKDSRENYLKYKNNALDFVNKRIQYFNKNGDFKFNNISIRNQKTRWGSCSSKKNLNFNYKIVLLPKHIADYIIVHELCHLKEMNHSKNFWNLVAKIIPDYINIRKELKIKGLHLQ